MERRNTRQKKLIMEAISGTNVHLTADEVLEIVRREDPGIGLATVYRNLNLFVEEGLIQKIEGTGWSCFDGNPKPHDHFHCTCCGKVVDYPDDYNEDLDRKASDVTGGDIIYHTTTYEGVCAECLAKQGDGLEKA
ncbi:MAG: transcriptional repressor [Eubacteriales bacterium]|jgi:Fur family ferric uptake transcriptional regulator/Fur family peroxide stress response transcriptional regulator